MSQHTGGYPQVRLDTARVSAIGAAGGVLLTKTATVTGLLGALSSALTPWRKPFARHDPGKILLDLAMTLALGGDACADVATLRAEPALYGPVASDATVSRTIAALAADVDRVEDAVDAARVLARTRAWALAGSNAPNHRVDAANPLVIDVDARLVSAHSDKELAAVRAP